MLEYQSRKQIFIEINIKKTGTKNVPVFLSSILFFTILLLFQQVFLLQHRL